MEVYLPSEIARLVLGYLKEENCEEAACHFLSECPHLSEYKALLRQGREFSTRVDGVNLQTMVHSYGRMRTEKGGDEELRDQMFTPTQQVAPLSRVVDHLEKLNTMVANSVIATPTEMGNRQLAPHLLSFTGKMSSNKQRQRTLRGSSRSPSIGGLSLDSCNDAGRRSSKNDRNCIRVTYHQPQMSDSEDLRTQTLKTANRNRSDVRLRNNHPASDRFRDGTIADFGVGSDALKTAINDSRVYEGRSDSPLSALDSQIEPQRLLESADEVQPCSSRSFDRSARVESSSGGEVLLFMPDGSNSPHLVQAAFPYHAVPLFFQSNVYSQSSELHPVAIQDVLTKLPVTDLEKAKEAAISAAPHSQAPRQIVTFKNSEEVAVRSSPALNDRSTSLDPGKSTTSPPADDLAVQVPFVFKTPAEQNHSDPNFCSPSKNPELSAVEKGLASPAKLRFKQLNRRLIAEQSANSVHFEQQQSDETGQKSVDASSSSSSTKAASGKGVDRFVTPSPDQGCMRSSEEEVANARTTARTESRSESTRTPGAVAATTAELEISSHIVSSSRSAASPAEYRDSSSSAATTPLKWGADDHLHQKPLNNKDSTISAGTTPSKRKLVVDNLDQRTPKKKKKDLTNMDINSFLSRIHLKR